ncbi:hypothetical protein Shyd_58220 [Streptomyces hydrogenans]|uniref:Uncharacterized protein n=1 Tax=Streptomyces hydrogenans TaxID=1873719 RepID=A0ABQ3PHE7_9ACTN|nr:hypothetical protein Shyd_58220 [Streptomyces hydrogenans]
MVIPLITPATEGALKVSVSCHARRPSGFQDDELPLDDFDREVEENLSRFGTPVIGRYPYKRSCGPRSRTQ